MIDQTLPAEPKKRPAFQFYPGDWRRDLALRKCSLAARGMWIELMCIAHECEPYGTLRHNGEALQADDIAGLVGMCSPREAKQLLDELVRKGVAKLDGDGVIYSKRMVDDERIRNARAAGGKGGAEHGVKGAEHGAKGGRPATPKGVGKGGYETPLTGSQKPPPSSSSSSSPSEIQEEPTVLGDEAAPPRHPPCPTEALIALYHEHLPMLPRVEVVNDGRKRALSARWREVVTDADIAKAPDVRAAALDWWAWYFSHAAKSRFLTGRAKDWRADFDFLLTPAKFAKVVEGHYHKEHA